MSPEVPVTVTDVNPVRAEALAWRVSFRVAPCPSVVAVTPFGRGDRLRLTLSWNPLSGVIVIWANADEFWFKNTLFGPERVKPVLLTALLIAFAYCAARPLPTKSS